MDYTPRTRDEIEDRIAWHLKNTSSIGVWWAECLLPYAGYGTVRPLLNDDMKTKYDSGTEQWGPRPLSASAMLIEAVDYLAFAIGKCRDHRGISAWRSIEKINDYCWLLGAEPDLVTAEPYAMYGAPGLKKAARFLGYEWPADDDLNRMALGVACSDECLDGCTG